MARKRTSVYLINNRKDTWDNDSRTENHLLPGSPGYDAYVEDLQEEHPSQPDDEMHEVLEDYNESWLEKMLAQTDAIPDPVERRKARLRIQKRILSEKVYERALLAAEKTDTLLDDARVRDVRKYDRFLDDVAVSPEDYEGRVDKFVKDGV